jgi:hypothetical protein
LLKDRGKLLEMRVIAASVYVPERIIKNIK